MIIPQEIFESGVCTVCPETDPELVLSVEMYNERMRERRHQKRVLKMLESIFLSLNIVMVIILGLIPKGAVYIIQPRIEWLEWTALGVFAAGFLFFGLWKRNCIFVAALTLLLLIVDLRYAFVLVVDSALAFILEKKRNTLKSAQGYPYFKPIKIEKKQ